MGGSGHTSIWHVPMCGGTGSPTLRVRDIGDLGPRGIACQVCKGGNKNEAKVGQGERMGLSAIGRSHKGGGAPDDMIVYWAVAEHGCGLGNHEFDRGLFSPEKGSRRRGGWQK